MSRRRAISLVLVHVLVLFHIAHWWLSGSTLSPLEPSEAGFSLLDGAVNAGAIFLCILILSTLVFGRFFCGWACHVVAYQDLARWLLIKMRIRPKPVRSRLLFLVPLFTAYWLFAHPLIMRWWTADQPANYDLSLHLTKDDFWETFPGPVVAILTFLVCGFVIIYFLGSKGFCFYGCPYGGLFGVADKFAKGRIRVTDDCDGSSVCTATCSSNVDVAREVREYGMVVDPGCLKCMDCITVCPNQALYFGFSPRSSRKPPQNAASDSRHKPKPDFTWPEEVFMAVSFASAFVILNNLYRTVPLLLAVGLSSIAAYALLVFVRLAYAGTIRVQNLTLKHSGGITRAGGLYAAAMVLVLAILVHSAMLQWHIHRGVAAFEKGQAARRSGDSNAASAAWQQCERHLLICNEYGLIHTSGAGRMLGEICLGTNRPKEAARHLQRELEAGARFSGVSGAYVPILLGEAIYATGRADEAERLFRESLKPRLRTPERVIRLASAIGLEGKHHAAREVLVAGLETNPASGDIAIELCKLLIRSPDPNVRNEAQALRTAERASAANGRSHADLLAMLAFLYSRSHQPREALESARLSLQRAREQGLVQLESDMLRMVQEYEKAVQDADFRERHP